MRFATGIAAALIAFGTVAGSAQAPQGPAQAPPPQAAAGQAVFNRSCATCHAPGNTVKAPTPDVLRQLSPEAIVNALINGKMTAQAAGLTDVEKASVAEFLSGRALALPTANSMNPTVGRCTTSKPMTDPAKGPAWSGWGAAITNARYAANGGLAAADLPKLKLKWAFGIPKGMTNNAQPTVVAGRVFMATDRALRTPDRAL